MTPAEWSDRAARDAIAACCASQHHGFVPCALHMGEAVEAAIEAAIAEEREAILALVRQRMKAASEEPYWTDEQEAMAEATDNALVGVLTAIGARGTK